VGGGVFLLIGILFNFFANPETIDSFGGKLLSVFCISFGSYQLIYGLFRPRLIFTFDRLSGMVTYPEVKWNNTNTIAFKDSEWVIKYNIAGRFFTGMSLSMVQRNGWSAVAMLEGDFYDLFSFIVWFMDKNRPLPPGTFFDSQRKADYERRKAEGFPRPLYEATISIPRK
jgi:hypothetical protein